MSLVGCRQRWAGVEEAGGRRHEAGGASGGSSITIRSPKVPVCVWRSVEGLCHRVTVPINALSLGQLPGGQWFEREGGGEESGESPGGVHRTQGSSGIHTALSGECPGPGDAVSFTVTPVLCWWRQSPLLFFEQIFLLTSEARASLDRLLSTL